MSNKNNLKGIQFITIIIVAAFFVGAYTLKGNKLADEVHNEPAISQSSSSDKDSADTKKNTSSKNQKKEINSDTASSDTDSDTDTDTSKDTDTDSELDTEDKKDSDKDTDSESESGLAQTVFPYSGVWNLIVVNKYNPIPDDYEFSVEEFENGKRVDIRIIEDLSEMFYDMRFIGLYPEVTEGYRTSEDQQAIMDEYIAGYIEQGKTKEEAAEMAKSWVAKPGTSEHEIGLALDINPDSNYESEYNTAENVYNWLAENAYKYGFILRYPKGKESITGIDFEPWHYRYVGKTAAQEIYNSGLCLEEYLAE